MIGDLKDQLEPVGRLDALDAVAPEDLPDDDDLMPSEPVAPRGSA